jgi:hypothetical protein
MTEPERPTFGAAEVLEVASKFEADDDAFVIGGQATNFWAWFYQDKEPALKLDGPFTSEDIDYFGTQDIARNVAAALGGELYVPEPGEHTPNTAKIVANFHGKPLVIDFLGSVLGIHDREIRRGVSVFEVPTEIDGEQTKVLIKVIHPLLCLKSRIVSMLHPATRRTDNIARTQAEAARVIVRRFIGDAIDDGAWGDVNDCFRQLYWYLRSDEFVKVADIKLGIDPLEILRHFADDKRIDKRYREMQIQKMISNIERKRRSRRQPSECQTKLF